MVELGRKLRKLNYLANFLEELLRLWRLTWDFLTIVLVATDAIILPIRLAWPDRFVAGGPVDELYKVRHGEKMWEMVRVCKSM